MQTYPLRPWRGLDMQFSKAELDVFVASTYMVAGDGTSTLFWEDRWMDGQSIKEIAPGVYALIPKRRRRQRTVQQALVERGWISDIVGVPTALALWQYVQLRSGLRDAQLSRSRTG
ncbi:uncharacterized protein [Lolium perenne]|uniref:uncharacterized protein n=1 Tax=Lolium perenne TaxID=4522 RepID=UPI003A9A1041